MAQRILIIDDDPAQLRILEESIKRFGFAPLTANGGEKGLEILSSSTGATIELIILDLVMPGMDGMEFLEHLSAHRT
ncbi:MAG TPA: response regulator, partial [Rhizobiales bacterium]|nr:response regulator [Hyphomicrobiales bacterium]